MTGQTPPAGAIDPETALPADRLYRACPQDLLEFETTDDLPPLEVVPGQERAMAALDLCVAMDRPDYNLFAVGAHGLGKHGMVRRVLERHAAAAPTPKDWCYVHNFAEAHRPQALGLPAGRGARLRGDMKDLVRELRVAIPAALESEAFRSQKEAIEGEAKQKHEETFEALQKEAQTRGIALVRTPVGVSLAPVRDGEPMDAEAIGRLSHSEQEALRLHLTELEGRLQEILRQVPTLARRAKTRIRDLVRQIMSDTVAHLIDDLRPGYDDLPEVLRYLDAVQSDVIENAADFLKADGGEGAPAQAPAQGLPGALSETDPLVRFEVNLLVDNGAANGAPVIYEDHPAHQNLLGRVEHVARLGTLSTDFTLIKPGALHKANGGYLILDVRKVLTQPFAWEDLKRVLRARDIRIQSLGELVGMVSTVSLDPQPIPLSVTVVLLGEPQLYYLLSAHDPDCDELFKVPADFAGDIERSDDNVRSFAQLVATLARRQSLRPLQRDAVARVIEHASRLAADADRLSAHQQSLGELLCEADHWAGRGARSCITAEDVQQALDAKIYRSDRVREYLLDQIRRGMTLIDTAGAVVGQVNGLAVFTLGQFSFARPSRITARTRPGRPQVVDIEREVALGGPLHSKGVLILSGFIAARYALEVPLSLAASLVFEQSYGMVDGDSASSAELYALLSSLSGLPIKQSFAVTGSVNQLGEIQPIGGVNEKIEGFFDTCRVTGLTGTQGVLIPRSNAQHLMLRGDVVEAVSAGQFHIHAVATIDQGIALLTGVDAGARDGQGDAPGRYPEGSVNGRVEAALVGFAEALRRFAARSEKESET